MRRVVVVFCFICLLFSGGTINCFAQKTFKVDGETFVTGMITRQYLYDITFRDSFLLHLVDSEVVYATLDSGIIADFNWPIGGAYVAKFWTMNKQRFPLKCRYFTADHLVSEQSWDYDPTGKIKLEFTEGDKAKGTLRKETYSYSEDKINGDQIILVSSTLNGKPEFFTKQYYDKRNLKYKEVRLADNKKDVVHTESFNYDEGGRLVSRSIHFNEFNTTKTFKEAESTVGGKCFKRLPLSLKERVTAGNKVQILRKMLGENQVIINDPSCKDFEYSFKSFSCEILVKTNSKSGTKQAVLTIREKP